MSFTKITAKSNPMVILTSLACISFAVSGCQSMSGLSASQQLTPQQAKNELNQTFKKQLRQGFTYEAHVKFSNDKRLAVLEQATDEQLSNSKDKYDHCEHVHDEAYVTLLKQAKRADKDISDAVYDEQREEIKNRFLACDQQREDWDVDKQGVYLPNYDSNHTLEDLKKTKVLNEYLLRPLSAQFSGSYHPRNGKFNVLPAIHYQRRNLGIYVNQPISINFKTGDIYLWADNLAAPTSVYLDDKLGVSWRNKWLKFGLNDGSLPKNTTKNLLKAYIDAKQSAYAQEPISGFRYVNKQQLQKALPNLASEHSNMMDAHHIIARSHHDVTDKRQTYLINKAFYRSMTTQYPELFQDVDDVKLVVNTEEAEADDGKSEELAVTKDNSISSKWLLAKLFEQIKQSIDEYESDYEVNDKNLTVSPVSVQQHYGLNADGQLSWWHYRLHLHNTDIDSDSESQGCGGSYDEDELNASMAENDLAALSKASQEKPDESMTVDMLTQFNGLTASTDFASLPVDVRIPNEQNSIDLRNYGKDLWERYKKGEGSAFASIIAQAYQSYNVRVNKNIDEDAAEAVAALDEDYDDSSDDESMDSDSLAADALDAECVDKLLELEGMCEFDRLDSDDTAEVQACLDEQAQLQQEYDETCQ